MTRPKLFPGFASIHALTFGTPRISFAHDVMRCSAQGKIKNAKKRVRQRVDKLPENGRIISDVALGDEYIGTITNVGPANSSWVDIGVFTEAGLPVSARLRLLTQTSSHARKDVEGAVIPVYVTRLNRQAGRIEVRKGVKPQHPIDTTSDITMLEALNVGDKLRGTVLGVGPFGAVVDVNVGRKGKGGMIRKCHGLLQRPNFRKEWYSSADQVIRSDAEVCITVGDTVDVYVLAAHVQNAFLLLDGSEVRPDDVAEASRQYRAAARRRYRRAPVSSLEVGEIRDGTVAEIKRYGLFVDVGVKSHGLIHYTEMGEKHKRDWKEVINLGAQLSVEVTSLESNKISLRLVSIKEEALREALDAADSATARVEDVELVRALQASGKGGRQKQRSGLNKSSQLNETSQATKAKRQMKNHESIDEDDRAKANDERQEEDEEDLEKFSDEYFEDKYGF